MKKSQILVTGGAGFIGSHACKALHKAGFEPIVLDNLCTGHQHNVKWGPLIKADLANKEAIRGVFKTYSIEAVIHFAAHAYVGESIQKPQKYYLNNVANTLNLLEVMLEKSIKHIVFSSSCATYGIPETLPITEQQPQNPINPYGHTKLIIEKVLKSYSEAYGLNSISLRYFNAAGADPEGELGEEHDPETHLIPLVILTALGQRNHLKIFGHDYETPDGTAVRDYIHVSDLAKAHVLALKYLLEGGQSTALNLGTEQSNSILEIVHLVEKLSMKKVNRVFAQRRVGDPPSLVANASLANQVLGWNAQYNLTDSVYTALNFHLK